MGKLGDKVLVCRQCGKEFTFTEGEQEFYAQRGLSQPSRCPQCRSDNRKRDLHLVCSGCGSELGRDGSAYCLTCVENLKLEADFKLQGQQKEIEELKTKLGNLSELEVRVASTTAEVEKSRQTKKELQSRVQALELEKSKLAAELASSHSLEASVCRLREQFEAFQESYIRDVEKVLGILPKVQSALSQRQNGSLLQCIKLTLMGGIGGRSEAPGDLKNSCIGRGETERIGMVLDSHEETAAKEGETSRTGPLS